MRTAVPLLAALAALASCGDNLPATIDAPAERPVDAPPAAPADAVVATCTPVRGTDLTTEPYLPPGTFDRPVLVTAPAGDRRTFVVEQAGLIRIVDQDAVLTAPFLDLRGDSGGPVYYGGSEQGLLGLAFHPDFAGNGRFFVYYTAQPDGANVIAEYRVGSDGRGDPTTARIVLSIPDGNNSHNGGMLAFSPQNGYLHLGLGDGGGGNDPQDHAEDVTSLFGKVLRLDVDGRTGDKAYGIPPSNPYAASPDGAADPRPEIWVRGLRNPWRLSFDDNGDLWIGDVGQAQREEIDLQRGTSAGGEHFGWDDIEGTFCSVNTPECSTAGTVLPVVDHPNDPWCAVIGGAVYRGSCFPDLVGTYVYSDYCVNQLWAMTAATADDDHQETDALPAAVTSIHADALGELYVTMLDGAVLHVIAQ